MEHTTEINSAAAATLARLPHRHRSYWFNSADAYVPTEPLRGSTVANVCVIGGGITGVSAAYHLRLQQPTTSVALVEAEVVGFGASGRNAGQLIVAFGRGDFHRQLSRYGAARLAKAYEYVHDGIRLIEGLQTSEQMSFDYDASGCMFVGLRAEGTRTIDAYHKFLTTIGQESFIEQVAGTQIQSEFGSPYLGAGVFDPRGGQFNPLKLVRGLAAAARRRGAHIFENSPVVNILRDGPKIRVLTPMGEVQCDQLVLATNGYTHQLPGLDDLAIPRTQAPIIARGNITEPLSPDDWQRIGWPRRCGVNVVSDLFHSFAPTIDGRILYVNGYFSAAPADTNVGPEVDWRLKTVGPRHLAQFFPKLKTIKGSQTWGGPISITADFIPHVGRTADARIVYALGCWGHGVPIGVHNGRTLAEIVLQRTSASTEMWFVTRAKRNFPTKGVARLGARMVMASRKRNNVSLGASMDPPIDFKS